VNSLKFIFARSSIVFELQHYRLHSEKVETLLEQEMLTLKKDHEEMTKDWPEFERAEFIENARDDYRELGKIFPEIQRNSNVISVYSVLENNLNHLCSLYSRITESDIELKDFGETDIIKRAQVYLTKVAKVDFPSDHSSWEEIQKIQQIRNKLVHAQGIIPSGNSKLITYINGNLYLELNGTSKVAIQKGFVEYCTRVFGDFFEEFFTRNK
jgi:hypothetical protein